MITDYRWERLYTGRTHVVDVGTPFAKGPQAIAKRLRLDYPERRDVAALVREYETIAGLAGKPGVVRALALERDRALPVLLLERAGPSSLAEVLELRPLPLDRALVVAERIAGTLAEVHGAGLVHRDLNPANVVLDGDSPVLIDFGLATTTKAVEGQQGRGRLVGTPAYICPEQTGRTGLATDPRSDLYALGATLFHMIHGAPPFGVGTRGEMVHAHLARPVPRLAGVPSEVAALVARLLEKSPAERYQSARGVQRDLQQLVARPGAPIELGRSDVVRGLLIPQRLHGRDREVGRLERLLDEVHGARKPALAVVEGSPGVGKTALTAALGQAVARRRGCLLRARFDLGERNLPFGGWRNLISGLVEAAGDDEALNAVLRGPALETVGPGAAALVEIFPVLGQVWEVGTPAPASPLDAANRLHAAFVALWRAVSAGGRALVLVLDDLQWADAGSVELLETLLEHAGNRPLLVTAAVRPEELYSQHPWTAASDRVEAGDLRCERVRLAPLDAGATRSLCEEMLGTGGRVADDVAAGVAAAGRGIPLAVVRAVRALEASGRLRLAEGAWHLEEAPEAQDEGKVASDSPAIERALAELPLVSLEVVVDAAVLGGEIDLGDLAALRGASLLETVKVLGPACDAGVLLPSRDANRIPSGALAREEDLEGLDAAFAFAHDSIHAAALARLDAATLARRRLDAAWKLLEGAEPPVFDVAEHLLLGRDALAGADLERAAAHLELAARAALVKAASSTARRYAEVLVAWRPQDLEAHLLAARAAGANADVDAAGTLLERAGDLAEGPLDHARVTTELVVQRTVAGDLAGAVTAGLEGLEAMGRPLSADEEGVASAMGRTAEVVAEVGVDGLVDLPPMEDPEARAEMGLLAAMVPSTFFTNQLAFSTAIARMVERTLRLGVGAGSGYPLTFYGFMTVEGGDHDRGRALAEAGLELARRLGDPAYLCRVIFTFAHHVNHWGAPLRQNTELFAEAARCGLEAGDHQWAGYAMAAVPMNLLPCCRELGELVASVEEALPFLRETGNQPMVDLVMVYLAAARRLSGAGEEDPGAPDGNLMVSAVHDAVFVQVAWMEGRIEEAAAFADRAERNKIFLRGCMVDAERIFYTGLVRAEQDDGEALDECIEALEARARHAPYNFAHKVLILEGARARLRGDEDAAWRRLDDAASLARQRDLLADAAVANELAGRLLWELGRRTPAEAYLETSVRAWVLWGAVARVRRMAGDLPGLELQGGAKSSLSSSDVTSTPSSGPSTRTGSGDDLDLAAVEAATEAIAGELDMDLLLGRLLRSVAELAGATRVVLVAVDEGALRLPGGGGGGSDLRTLAYMDHGSVTRVDAPFAGDVAPRALVDEALRRGRPVLVDEVSRDPDYAGDPWVESNKPRTMACVPAVHQQRVAALLYLHNDMLASAFAPSRARLLSLIGTQVATALENARLFEELRRETEERLEQERAMQATQRMESLGRLAAGIAHDFNNLLAVVMGWADALGRDAEEDSREGRALDQITRAARRGADLSGQLLAYARTASFEPRAVDVGALTTDLARMLERVTGDDVSLELRVSERPLHVLVDPGHFEQVLTNLVVNARDAMPDGGTIDITVEGTEDLAEAAACVRVSDEGMGIPPAVLERIFEPFFTTKGTHGTGLGLATCKGIIEQSGGELRVESSPGRGATFEILLPLTAPGDTAEERDATAEPVAAGRAHVLVVDDSPDVRAMLEYCMELIGYQTTFAASPEEALEILDGGLRPDALLTDMMMPGMTGLELAHEARRRGAVDRALIISGLQPEVPDEDAGWIDTLLKPFTVDSLSERLAALLAANTE